MTTSTAASVRTGLMQRIVCTACGHLHRLVIADRCDCCKADCRHNPADARPATA